MHDTRPHILVVDNNSETCSNVASILAMFNYDVKSASTADEAMSLVANNEFDCAVFLIELPEGGFELSQQIRKLKLYTDIPFAFATRGEIDNALAMEAQFYDGLFLFHIPYNEVHLLTQLSSMVRIKHLQDELKKRMAELDKLASIDPLTGLYNRRLFFQRLKAEVSRAKRHNSPMTLVFIDIDFFKQVNDTYGHLAGDIVLKKLAKIMTNQLRGSDVLGRLGGEEFMIMLPDTIVKPGLEVAERLRIQVENSTFSYNDKTIPVTISAGVYHFPDPWTFEVDEMVHLADQALYEAKDTGRNKVVFHSSERTLETPEPGKTDEIAPERTV